MLAAVRLCGSSNPGDAADVGGEFAAAKLSNVIAVARISSWALDVHVLLVLEEPGLSISATPNTTPHNTGWWQGTQCNRLLLAATWQHAATAAALLHTAAGTAAN